MKLVLAAISFLIIPRAFKGMVAAVGVLIKTNSLLFPLLIGLGICVILYYLILRKMSGLTVWEHEFTHAIVALMFFRKIHRFVSSSQRGYVVHSNGFGGKFGDVLIKLAPYYFPTFTFILALIRPFVPLEYLFYYDTAVGFSLGYHTLSTLDEIKRNFNKRTFFLAGTNELTLTDIGQTGMIASVFIIIAFTLLIHGVIFKLIIGGYKSVYEYFIIIYDSSIYFILEITRLIDKVIKLFLV